MFYNSSSSWGINGSSSGDLIFQLGSTNQISGWSFNSTSLYKDNITLDSANGRINVEGPTAQSYVRMFYVDNSNWGLEGKQDTALVFKLGDTNKITSFEFNTHRFVNYTGTSEFASGNGILMQGTTAYPDPIIPVTKYCPSFQAYKHNGSYFTTQVWLGMQYPTNDTNFTSDPSVQDLGLGVVTKSDIGAEFNRFSVKAGETNNADLDVIMRCSTTGKLYLILDGLQTSGIASGQVYYREDIELGRKVLCVV
jgi:hypothetical protein